MRLHNLLAKNNLNIAELKEYIQSHDDELLLINRVDRTPMHIACQYQKDLKIFELLLSSTNGKKALTMKDNAGETPMHIACERQKDLRLFDLFLSSGGGKTMTIKDNTRKTPMHHACQEQEDPKIFELLLRNGGGKAMSIKGFHGRTPMHIACEWQRYPKIFELLLNYGGGKALMIKDDYDQTPINYLKYLDDDVKKPIIKEIIKYYDKQYLSRAERRGNIVTKIKALIRANPDIINQYTNKGYEIMNIIVSEGYLKKKVIEKQEKRERERVKKIRYVKSLSSTPSASQTSSSLLLQKLVTDKERKNLNSRTRKSNSSYGLNSLFRS